MVERSARLIGCIPVLAVLVMGHHPTGVAADEKGGRPAVVVKAEYFQDFKEGKPLPAGLTGSIDKERDAVVIEQAAVKVPAGAKQVFELTAQSPYAWYSSSPGVVPVGKPEPINPDKPAVHAKYGRAAWMYTFEVTPPKGSSTLVFEYRRPQAGAKPRWIYRVTIEN